MKNIIDEKQEKANAWFDELEKFAKEKRMPARILDEIKECRERLSSSEIDWDEINQMAGELLESIEEKAYPEALQNKQSKQEVSTQDVEEQVKKMAQRCHAENITSIEIMADRKNILLKKNYDQLMEISYTKAHLEELKNEDLLIQFFQNCKNAYEKDVLEMIREMLQSVSSNYNHMLNHMKSMFESIGGFKNGVGNEKFYREYEERRSGIDKKVLGEAESSDMGGNELLSFGQKTGEMIKGIVRKLVRKRKILAWIPLVILLCIFVGSAIGNQAQNREVIESTNTESDTDNSMLKEAAIDVGAKMIKSASSSAIMSVVSAIITLILALVISLGALLIFIILLMIVIYWFYLKILNTWCNHQICTKCGALLKTELIQYTQNNHLSSKLDEVMENAMNEYERQYMIVLNNIFQGSSYDSGQEQKDEKNRLTVLHDAWDKIIYE